MNVYPRQALAAVQRDAGIGTVQIPVWNVAGRLLTSAEFVAAFVPAERLDALIDAARAWVDRIVDDPALWADAADRALIAALRAYDEGQER